MTPTKRARVPAVVHLTALALGWAVAIGSAAPAQGEGAKPETSSQEPAQSAPSEPASRPQGRRGAQARRQAPAGAAIAIENVKIVRPGEPDLENATIVLRGRKILALGSKVAIPENARRIDGRGGVLTAGWIDARGETPLDAASANDGAPSSELHAADALDLLDPHGRIPEALSRGVIAAYVAAGRGLFAGTGTLVLFRPREVNVDNVTVDDAEALTIVGGSARGFMTVARLTDWTNLRRTLREAQKHREALDAYQEELAKYLEAKKKGAKTAVKPAEEPRERPAETPDRPPTPVPRGRRPPRTPEEWDFLALARVLGIPPIVEGRDGGFLLDEAPADVVKSDTIEGDEDCGCGAPGPHKHHPPGADVPLYIWPLYSFQGPPATKPGDTKSVERPKKPDFNAMLTPLVAALRREAPVRFEVRRADEIRAAIALAKEFKLRAVLEGLDEGSFVLDEIAESDFPVVIAPVFDPAAPEATIAEGFARTASLAAECEKRKIPFAFGTGRGAFATAWLRTQAALAVAGGLTRDAALAAVTTRAAEILGVDHEMGALRPGRGANVVLFDGDPFDPSTPVRLTIVEGDILYQR